MSLMEGVEHLQLTLYDHVFLFFGRHLTEWVFCFHVPVPLCRGRRYDIRSVCCFIGLYQKTGRDARRKNPLAIPWRENTNFYQTGHKDFILFFFKSGKIVGNIVFF